MADEIEPVHSRDELLDLYKQAHTNQKEKDIKELNHHGRKYLNSVSFSEKFVIFLFPTFLEEILKNSSGNTSDVFTKIRKGFENLEKYGIKLLQFPWRKEYYTIKLYTPFFKHGIEPVVPSHIASSIIQLYGYKEKSRDVLELDQPPKSFDCIIATAFELFLGAIELEVMRDIADEVDLYTDEYAPTDIIRARQKTTGDAKVARKYLLRSKGLPGAEKRIKKDKSESENPRNMKDETSSHSVRSRSFPQESSMSNSRGLADYGSKSPYSSRVGSVKAKHVGSSNGFGLPAFSDEELYGVQQGEEVAFSDAELYGVHTPTVASLEYEAMEVEPDQNQHYSARQSDYEDMNANNDDNIYESMARQDYNLPKLPSRMEDLPPPPTYSEAVKLNTPDEWEVIPSPSNQTVKGVSTTINGLSGLNISENGTNFDEKGISDHGRPSKYEVKKYGGKGSGDTNGELINMEYLNAKGMTTVTTTSACSSSGVARDNPKTAYPKISDSQPSNGYVKGNQETPRLMGESAYYKDLTASDVSSKRRTSPRSDQLSACTATSKPGMSGVMLPPCSSPQSTATEPLSREVPPLHQSTATEPLSREAPPLQYSHTQTSPHAHKYLPSKEATKNVCKMCLNVPTHYCNICAKLCCSSCVSSLNRLPCDGAQIHHIVERSRPSSTKEKDIHKQEDVCVNCNKPSTHECSICKIKCCNVCQHIGTFKEKCTSSIGHVFIPAKSDAALYNGLALHREIQKDFDEQNICVQCGLSAKFICADCHNIVCKVCLDIFKRDLCPATKKEHFFQIIMAQIQRTDTKKAEPWSCKRCTYVNPPENRICSMCATSQGVTGVEYPESGSRRCGVCTYGNKEGARICAMCNRSLGLDKAESYL